MYCVDNHFDELKFRAHPLPGRLVWAAGALIVAIGLLSLQGCAASRPDATPETAHQSRGELAEMAIDYPSEAPADSGLLDDVRELSAGAMHTCALRGDGAVYCWGGNTTGELGDGTREGTAQPVRVVGLPPAQHIEAGIDRTCAVSVAGDVYCWGADAQAQLGNQEDIGGTAVPVRADALRGAARLALSGSGARACATTEQSLAACWGELGVVLGEARSDAMETPIPTYANTYDVVEVAVGARHECALVRDGSVRCRGLGDEGQLGRRTDEVQAAFLPVPGVERARALVSGARHLCAIVEEGRVLCWGDGAAGQTGPETSPGCDGAGERCAGAARLREVALPLPATSLAAGSEHTCAVLSDGAMHCWGANDRGQLGDGTQASSAEPVRARIDGLARAATAGDRHTCALLESGEARCWGGNEGGQLGDGTLGRERLFPVAVLDPSSRLYTTMRPGREPRLLAGR